MPPLSIIIPTHERARYAVPTVIALLEAIPEAEIVLSDTSLTDEISASLGAWRDNSRLVFIRPNRQMNVVEHFNYALQHATGDYLCFIGDDDFVLPELVQIAVWARETSVDAVRMNFPFHYYWPDFQHKTQGSEYSGVLDVTRFTSRVAPQNPKAELLDALRQLGTGVRGMPRAYAGLISAKLVRKIVQKHGALFGGVSPDIYSAALISAESEAMYDCDYPAIIPGFSGASTAGQSASGGHVGELRDNAHIGAFKDLVWDPLIPEFYSVPTVWAYSLMKAPIVSGHYKHVAGYGRLYVKCMIWHKHYRKYTRLAMENFRATHGTAALINTMFHGFRHEVVWILGKVWTRIMARIAPIKSNRFREVPDSASGIALAKKITSGPQHEKLQQAISLK